MLRSISSRFFNLAAGIWNWHAFILLTDTMSMENFVDGNMLNAAALRWPLASHIMECDSCGSQFVTVYSMDKYIIRGWTVDILLLSYVISKMYLCRINLYSNIILLAALVALIPCVESMWCNRHYPSWMSQALLEAEASHLHGKCDTNNFGKSKILRVHFVKLHSTNSTGRGRGFARVLCVSCKIWGQFRISSVAKWYTPYRLVWMVFVHPIQNNLVPLWIECEKRMQYRLPMSTRWKLSVSTVPVLAHR